MKARKKSSHDTALAKPIYVISGPSGVGKGTLIKKVREVKPIKVAISATTRSPRPGEINGKHYHFMNVSQFKECIDKKMFIEYAVVHGHYYGTLFSELQCPKDNVRPVILEIDVQGYKTLSENPAISPSLYSIFIMAVSPDQLEQRIRKRSEEIGQDPDEQDIAVRLQSYKNELLFLDKYDTQIVNDELTHAYRELSHAIEWGKFFVSRR